MVYGQFMATQDGIDVIEFNARHRPHASPHSSLDCALFWTCRFGDPEVMNLLSTLTTDFVVLCQAICEGTLTQAGWG